MDAITTSTSTARARRVGWSAPLLMAAVWAVDCANPESIAGGIPYVLVVLIGTWLPRRAHVAWITAICAALVVLGGMNAVGEGADPTQQLIVRAQAVVALTVTCLLVLAMRRERGHLDAHRGLLRAVLDNSPSLICVKDDQGRFILSNRNLEHLLGRSEDEILGCRDHDLFPPEVAAGFRTQDLAVLDQGEAMEGEEVVALEDGEHVFRTARFPLLDGSGRLAIGVVATDISARVKADLRLTQLGKALESIGDAVLITDREAVIDYVNPGFEHMTGWTQDRVRGRTPGFLFEQSRSPEVLEGMRAALVHGSTWSGTLLCRRRHAAAVAELGVLGGLEPGFFWARLHVAPVVDDYGRTFAHVTTARDVTEEVVRQERGRFERQEVRARVEVLYALQTPRPLEDRLHEALEVLLEHPDFQHPGRVGVLLFDESEASLVPMTVVGSEHAEPVPWPDELMLAIETDEPCRLGCGEHAHYYVPLGSTVSPLGMLMVCTASEPISDPLRMDMLRSVGEAIGLAIAQERAQEQLVAAREVAESATRAKSSFLANMSHEIRTPMTAILGFTEVLREAIPPGESRDALEIIRRNGEHLLDLINDILDLSKIEAGRMEFERIPCELAELLRDVRELMMSRADDKGVGFRLELEGPLPGRVRTDPTRLRQILINLVGNAIKFTPAGQVTLRVGGEPAGLCFDVLDTGMGMDEEQCTRLFQSFSQGDASTSRHFGGTGLGLVISRQLASLLGGTVELVRSAPGEGSHFRVRMAGLAEEGGTELAPEQMLERMAADSRERAGPTPEPDLGPARILMAEDGVDNQLLVRRILERAGAEVVTVENGALAVEAVREGDSTPFDLVLMDMQMPVMDGLEATRTLRAGGFRNPIVALTANAMHGDAERCLAAGCDAYESKPIDRGHLLATLRSLLGGGRQTRQ